MTLHKLTAGSGYDYLTRQVAVLDATDKGHTGLSTYYSERGESPGRWVGSGLSGLDGLEAGDVVTAEQMGHLFGAGYHPLFDERLAALPDAPTPEQIADATRLGRPFNVYERDVTEFQIEVAKRVAALADHTGEAVPPELRAQIRTMTGVEFFTNTHGRRPVSEHELHGFLAQQTRPKTTAVAGFDLTFSPVKSVSTLWAVADPAVAAAVERAHDAAVADALSFIEEHALFTRTGHGGVRQVDVTGLVAAAFTHRDSRAGDPDLHTHVAVANKVQRLNPDGTPGRQGDWLAIDGRVLFKAKVAASETYNTRLEHHLTRELGVRFAERNDPHAPARERGDLKRQVREIVGIDPALNARWSQRRRQIEDRQTDLAGDFRRTHGRPPTPVEALHLAQQANLETRNAKHSARSMAEQRAAWATQAAEVLGTPDAVRAMIDAALSPDVTASRSVDVDWVDRTAQRVIGELEQRRATWQMWHVHAEAQRQVRAANLDPSTVDGLVERVTAAALEAHSVSLAGPPDADFGIVEPAELRRRDGTSVYDVAGATRYSSARIMAAEQRLLEHAGRAPVTVNASNTPTLLVVGDPTIEVALLEAVANGTPLNPGQEHLVRELATSGRSVQLAIAPAGTGKTTALRALASAWTDAGGNVLALAPSAAATAAMTDVLTGIPGVHGDTLAKFTHTLNNRDSDHPDAEAWGNRIGPTTLVLIDEAGMADTLTLGRVVDHAVRHGAQVRLIGDDQQLAAIGAGGILRDIRQHHGAVELTELLRFTDPDEAAATLALRNGNPEALEFYLDHDRVHVGDEHSVLTTLHQAWAADRAAGLDSLMLAPTRDQVRQLNHTAQEGLFPVADGRPRATVATSDDLHVGVGDLVITRTNDRRLRFGSGDWVKNGDRWHVTGIRDDGSLQVRHQTSGLSTRLPAGYVRASVELGYATTIHAAQGTTVDTVHGLLAGTETRQDLYVMATRGRHANHLHLSIAATTGDPHELTTPGAIHPATVAETLAGILGHDGAAVSATAELAATLDPLTLHNRAADRLQDARTVACESVVGPTTIDAITNHARQVVPGIEDDNAWPTLRARLIEIAADDRDPVAALDRATQRGRLDNVHDHAATLTWRLELAGEVQGNDVRSDDLPKLVQNNPTWSTYLKARRNQLEHFRSAAVDATPNVDADEATPRRTPQEMAERHRPSLEERPDPAQSPRW